MNTNFPLTFYANPLSIQGHVLDEFATRITGGVPIVDANNVFTFAMEMVASIVGDATNKSLNALDIYYAKRAQTMNALFRHMSDYETVDLFSSPSNTTVSVTLDRNFLIRNAVDYRELQSDGSYLETNYKKVIIPKDTKFVIGSYVFGLYYPIEIKINKITNTFSVTYDATMINPLFTLSLNTVEHRFISNGGMTLISMSVPIYQFVRTYIYEDLIQSTGFIKTYSYNDRFYAVRVFTLINNAWIETAQSMSADIYDPTKLTAIVTVVSDTKKFQVVIPQVYFTKNMVGTRVKLELYTTLGALDADITNVNAQTISMSYPDNVMFDTNSDTTTYSAILQKLESIDVLPISTKIVGGSNGFSFEELRDKIVNNTLYDDALITISKLNNHFKSVGFNVLRYQDGITNRIYLCYKALTDNAGVNIGAAAVSVVFDMQTLTSSASIKDAGDGSFTVLPSTLYKYNATTKLSSVVSATELAQISGYDAAAKIAAYNSNTYLVSPFHLRIETDSRYPLAYTYNLNQPYVVDNIEFVASNNKLGTQVSAYSISIEHLNNGTGGYRIYVAINKSDDVASKHPVGGDNFQNMRLLVRTVNSANKLIWQTATYAGVDSGRDVFEFTVMPTYQITTNHGLMTTGSFVDGDNSTSHIIPLEAKFNLLFFVNNELVDMTDNPNDTPLASYVPSNYADFVPVISQNVTLSFGQLVTEAFNRVNVLYSNQEYAKWQDTLFATYPHDIYTIDPVTKVPAYTIADGHVVLDVLHRQGDLISTPHVQLTGSVLSTESLNSILKLQTPLTPLSSAGNLWKSIEITGSFDSGDLVDNKLTIVHEYGDIEIPGAVLNASAVEFVLSADKFVYESNKIIVDLASVTVSGTCSYSFSYGTMQAEVKCALSTAISLAVTVTAYEDLATLDSDTPFVWAMDASADITTATIVPAEDIGTGGALYYRDFIASTWVKWIVASKLSNISNWATNLSYVGLVYVVAASDTALPSYINVLSHTADQTWDQVGVWPWETTTLWQYLTITLDGVTVTNCLVTASGDTSFTLFRNNHPLVLHTYNDPILDASGNPVLSKDRELVYHINMTQVDAKLLFSQQQEHVAYLDKLRTLLMTYFNTVKASSGELLENTRIYYQPVRSIGTGWFKRDDVSNVELPLEFTMSLKLYVYKFVTEDIQLMNLIRDGILTILDKHIQSGTISCTAITDDIRASMADNIKFVDVLGINGDNTLQTLISLDTDTCPHLKQLLSQDVDGTIVVTRGLTLEFVGIEN